MSPCRQGRHAFRPGRSGQACGDTATHSTLPTVTVPRHFGRFYDSAQPSGIRQAAPYLLPSMTPPAQAGPCPRNLKANYEYTSQSQASIIPAGPPRRHPGALQLLEQRNIVPMQLIVRHRSGERGDVDPTDAKANADALRFGTRILLSYELMDGKKIWFITEADRSATTILLPSEILSRPTRKRATRFSAGSNAAVSPSPSLIVVLPSCRQCRRVARCPSSRADRFESAALPARWNPKSGNGPESGNNRQQPQHRASHGSRPAPTLCESGTADTQTGSKDLED